jgi:hypothetical protein
MPGLMTRLEAAEHLRVSPGWLRDHPEVPYVKLGRLVRYRVEDLDAWAQSQRVAPASGRSVRSRRRAS